jgi:hypothetical protein
LCKLAEIKGEGIGIVYHKFSYSCALPLQWADQVTIKFHDRELSGCRQQGHRDCTLAGADFKQHILAGRVNSRHNLPDNDGVVQEVLAEPFPWTVIQGVILVLVISYSQL